MEKNLKISVFCGSRSGNNPLYTQAAQELGRLFVQNNITLIFGGGSIGLMGAMADEMALLHGNIIGVLPKFFNAEAVGHKNVTEMIPVNSMSERKNIMADISDGFIALPGGIGTMDELFEVLTYSQLHLHEKPVGLLNTARFYDGLLLQLNTMVDEGFLYTRHYRMLLQDSLPDRLLQQMLDYTYSQDNAWLQKIKHE
ncbi:MAG: TIGR00730 family Rossman fold protein [Bacteroidales bacterium]|nr:TIGR00730 family Rossman fold protein [Bacteroidales bacterium]